MHFWNHDVSKNYQNISHLEHKLLYCSVQTDYVQTVQNVQTQAIWPVATNINQTTLFPCGSTPKLQRQKCIKID